MSKHKSKDSLIPGKIGYRTREGRTGLDPIDTQKETSYMEGIFLRKLFTGKLRTRNPVYLVVMATIGVLLVLFPLIGSLSDPRALSQPNALRDQLVIPILCLWPVGGARSEERR